MAVKDTSPFNHIGTGTSEFNACGEGASGAGLFDLQADGLRRPRRQDASPWRPGRITPNQPILAPLLSRRSIPARNMAPSLRESSDS